MTAVAVHAPEAPVVLDFEAARAAAKEAAPELFALAESKLQEGGKGGIKEIADGRSDEFRVNPFSLYVEPGWNSRDLDDPENHKHIDWLSKNIAENGVLDALEVYVCNGRLKIVDGHCRYFATMRAIANGAQIKTVPVKTVPKGSDEGDRILSQIVRNAGKRLSPLETGVVYKKLMALGWSENDIAKRSSCTVNSVRQLLALQEAPVEIKKYITQRRISATLAAETLRHYPEQEAIQIIRDQIAEADKTGRRRVTKKHIEKTVASFSPKARLRELLEAFSVAEVVTSDDEVLVRFDVATYEKVREALVC
jgi:hypothetical protein